MVSLSGPLEVGFLVDAETIADRLEAEMKARATSAGKAMGTDEYALAVGSLLEAAGTLMRRAFPGDEKVGTGLYVKSLRRFADQVDANVLGKKHRALPKGRR